MPHLPAEEAPGSPPLRQLMGRLAGRVALALWRLVHAHQIVQEVHLSSTGVSIFSSKIPLQALLRAGVLLGMQAHRLGCIIG